VSVTVEAVIAEMRRLGYVVFDAKDHDMNVVTLRRIPGTPNTFDDLLCCFYREKGAWIFNAWPCTTDPGSYHLQNPGRVAGTAIVKPGQYRASHEISFHHIGQPNQYEAMRQCGVLKVWRDADKDAELDYGMNEQDASNSGINIHKAGKDSSQVDKWSAGCQVFKKEADFLSFMEKMHLQKSSGLGSKISLTVLEWPAEKF
jgi:hypothetical protein